MPRFAANLTTMFNEVPFLDRFAASAKSGFTAVEHLFPYEFDAARIVQALQDNGLPQALFNLPVGDWVAGERGLAALHDRQADFRASVKTALTYAPATGVGRLHVVSGIADRKDPSAATACRASLAYLADLAGKNALDIAIEPINPRDIPGYFLNDFNYAADLIADLGVPNVKLQFDIHHRQILHGDVPTGLPRLLPIVGHEQIAAVPLRNEPCPGELDDVRIVKTLDSLGYTGFADCEYRPAGDTVSGLV